MCGRLFSVIINSGTKTIGNRAFFWANNLKTIYLPKSVTSIGESAFNKDANREVQLMTYYEGTQYNFFNLISFSNNNEHILNSKVNYESESPDFEFVNDGVFLYQRMYGQVIIESFLGWDSVNNGLSIDLGDYFKELKVIGIHNYAFSQKHGFKEIIIPNTVLFIGKGAFYECGSLQNVVFSNGLETIGSEAFYKCTNLRKIILPNSLTSIGVVAFAFCVSVDVVFIPLSVTIISGSAFYLVGRTTSPITIFYVEALSKPVGWSTSWVSSNRTIQWGYTGDPSSL
jgi:hypothetical protein